eukprot:5440203-Alexandrium_andersonii.AAC.1
MLGSTLWGVAITMLLTASPDAVGWPWPFNSLRRVLGAYWALACGGAAWSSPSSRLRASPSCRP